MPEHGAIRLLREYHFSYVHLWTRLKLLLQKAFTTCVLDGLETWLGINSDDNVEARTRDTMHIQW